MKSARCWLLAIYCLCSSLSAFAVDVRGRIDTTAEIFGGSKTGRPTKGVYVDFCANEYSQQTCYPAETGYDGIYYLSIPPGNYEIRINGSPQARILIPDQPAFDIAPVQGR